MLFVRRPVAAHTLKPWQHEALDYAIPRKRIALFMEMRLGKTPVSIRWTKARGAQRVLLVAPLSTLLGQLNWQGELNREGIHPVMLSQIPTNDRMAAVRPSSIASGSWRRWWARGWFCVNYEALRTQPELLAGPWDAIILDESTRIRNPKAQVTKLLLNHTSHVPMRALLSGLPNPESAMDYFCQFKFRDGHFLHYDNFWAFKQAHYYQGWTSWDWRLKKKALGKIRDYIHNESFTLTRKEAGVGSTKHREQRSVQLNATQRQIMKQVRRDFAVDETETKWVPVTHMWLQRLAGGFHPITHELVNDSKIRLVEELLVDQFRKQPVVIWFKFTAEILAVAKWLKQRTKIKFETVHGATPKSDRPQIQERFQEGSTQVVLLQVKLGRYGWNLSRSNTALYYSNTYEFEDRSQSEDRIIHLTKKTPCLYIDLVTMGTPDEEVVAALGDKRLNARIFNMRLHKAVSRYGYIPRRMAA